MIAKNLVLNKARRLKLPLRPISTALQLIDRLSPFFDKHPSLQDSDAFRKSDLISNICLFLGCKFEDVHGHLDKIISSIPNADLDKILPFEVEIYEFLNFDFSFFNIYQFALAVKLQIETDERAAAMADESKIDWNLIVCSLNKAMLLEFPKVENYRVYEIILGSFPLDIQTFRSFLPLLKNESFDYEKIRKVHNSIKDVKILSDEEITEYFNASK